MDGALWRKETDGKLIPRARAVRFPFLVTMPCVDVRALQKREHWKSGRQMGMSGPGGNESLNLSFVRNCNEISRPRLPRHQS